MTIALQVAPTVKAYTKTIGQPAQNVLSQMLIRMVLHSVETIIGVDTLGNGKLSGDGMQWEPSNPQYRDTRPSGIRLGL